MARSTCTSAYLLNYDHLHVKNINSQLFTKNIQHLQVSFFHKSHQNEECESSLMMDRLK